MNVFSISHLKNLLAQTFYLLQGLIGFGSIIIIHELGHLFACKFFGVSVPYFSLGFGPTIAQLIIGDTTFGIGIMPIGGFVSIDQAEFALQPYITQIAILASGIIANLFIALCIYHYLGKSMQEFRNALFGFSPQNALQKSYTTYHRMVGPIGILRSITESIKDGLAAFLPTFATLNIFIALTNILPIPLLDGGKIVRITLGQFIDIDPAADYYVAITSVLILLVLLIVASYKDIKNWVKK